MIGGCLRTLLHSFDRVFNIYTTEKVSFKLCMLRVRFICFRAGSGPNFLRRGSGLVSNVGLRVGSGLIRFFFGSR